MQKYKDVLEKAARKELSTLIFVALILLLIIVAIWGSNYLYFNKMKKKHPTQFASKKQIKIRRQSIWASIALTVICVGVMMFFGFDVRNTISDINKDIEENAYVTYVGDYYINSVISGRRNQLYDRWLTVDLDNYDYAYIYVNSFFNALSMEEGEFKGKVVYGKNSLIIVDMTK